MFAFFAQASCDDHPSRSPRALDTGLSAARERTSFLNPRQQDLVLPFSQPVRLRKDSHLAARDCLWTVYEPSEYRLWTVCARQKYRTSTVQVPSMYRPSTVPRTAPILSKFVDARQNCGACRRLCLTSIFICQKAKSRVLDPASVRHTAHVRRSSSVHSNRFRNG